MKTTHTAGEWIVNPPFINDSKPFISNGESVICYMVLNPSASLNNQSEAEANARLIAASPDLLEALQSCLNWAKNGNQEDLIVFEAAQAAINKATGNNQ